METTIERTPFNVYEVRKDFPVLEQEVFGKPLVYLDNGATSQKPKQVIERMKEYYENENSNIHRGVHHLSQQATTAYEDVRLKCKNFLNARHSHEIIFTSGTTHGINLIAQSFGDKFIKKGDEILISHMEHHSNIVPWQLLCERSGAILKVVPINEHGELILEEFDKLLTEKTKLVSVVHVSNTLGTINPVEYIIEAAHKLQIPVVLDGAQAVPHQSVDVQALDVDFFVCSGHKMFSPTGIGILYGKEEWLNAMPPYMGGGDMIETVSFEKTTFNELPHKFEAGTPNIAAGLGLGAGIDYIQKIGYDAIKKHEQILLEYATERLIEIPEVRIIGNTVHKASVISFLVGDIHPYDTGTILDQMGIAVRTGHHCTQPIMDRYGIPGTVRASFALYNTKEEVDKLIEGIHQVKRMFG